MKKIINISILLILIATITSCGNRSKKVSAQTEEDKNLIKDSTDLTKYYREWFEIDNEEKSKKEQVELYISELRDTIVNQNKYFINGELDSTKSAFYELDLSPQPDGKYQGRITIHSRNIHNIKSPIIRRRLQLYLLNREDSINTQFESIDKNHIEFSYYSSNDTLIGILFDKLEIDTIINNENKVRLLDSKYYLDNKSETVNTLIKAFQEK